MGRWLAHRLRPGTKGKVDGPGAAAEPAPPGLEAFPCRLGDVVVRLAERDEAWLAGALVFEEQQPVAALFVAPEAGADRAVLVHHAEEGLLWLSPLGPAPLVLPGDPPMTLEHAGARFERWRRLPVRVRRLGAHAPAVGDTAVVAEYRGPGAERAVVVAGDQRTCVWVGIALRNTDFDVLPALSDDAATGRS